MPAEGYSVEASGKWAPEEAAFMRVGDALLCEHHWLTSGVGWLSAPKDAGRHSGIPVR
jgi:hypothetical protein